MTDYDLLLRITRIVEGAKLRMGWAERGECPEGMSEEQWEDAQLSDVLDQIAEGAIADIRGILR